jgi:hypothetical protein
MFIGSKADFATASRAVTNSSLGVPTIRERKPPGMWIIRQCRVLYRSVLIGTALSAQARTRCPSYRIGHIGAGHGLPQWRPRNSRRGPSHCGLQVQSWHSITSGKRRLQRIGDHQVRSLACSPEESSVVLLSLVQHFRKAKRHRLGSRRLHGEVPIEIVMRQPVRRQGAKNRHPTPRPIFVPVSRRVKPLPVKAGSVLIRSPTPSPDSGVHRPLPRSGSRVAGAGIC